MLSWLNVIRIYSNVKHRKKPVTLLTSYNAYDRIAAEITKGDVEDDNSVDGRDWS